MFEITKKLNGEIIETTSLPNMSKVWNYAREWRNGLTAEQISQKAEFIIHDTEAENDLMDLRITAKAGKNGKVLMMNSNPASRRSVQDRAKKAEAEAVKAEAVKAAEEAEAVKAAEEAAKVEADKIAAEEAKRAKRREYDRKRRAAKKAAKAAA